METKRFGVTTTVFLDAADPGEAALIVERDLAGRFDSNPVSVSARAKASDGAHSPTCGSSASSTMRTSPLAVTSAACGGTACLEERDEHNHRIDELRSGIVAGTIDSIPDVVRQTLLDRIKSSGFSRRCPCLYHAEHGFQGYELHSYGNGDEVDDYDERSSLHDCELCGGSGNYNPLPKLLHDGPLLFAGLKGSGPC